MSSASAGGAASSTQEWSDADDMEDVDSVDNEARLDELIPSPLHIDKLSPLDCWARGKFLVAHQQAGVPIAKQVVQLVQQQKLDDLESVDESQGRSEIHGSVVQTYVDDPKTRTSEQRKPWEPIRDAFHTLVCNLLRLLGLTKLAGEGEWMGLKTLCSRYPHGAQARHFDGAKWPKREGSLDHVACTALLSCSELMMSTHLPLFDAASFHEGVSEEKLRELAVLVTSPRSLQSVVIRCGTVTLLLHHVLHAGAAALQSHPPRIMLFDTITLKPVDVDQQYFEWNFIRDVYGPRSHEYRKSLTRNMKHRPFEREPNQTPSQRKALEELWEWYYGEADEQEAT